MVGRPARAVQARVAWITDDNNRSPLSFPVATLPATAFASSNSMALTPDDVSRIAHLARLDLQADERQAMLAQLNGFFSIVEQMSAVDTRGVAPLYTPLSAVGDVALRLRDDIVTECDERALNQRSAPAVEDGLFLVPKVME
jgi:aspartyl-tRNA(Asn)/glutamyl-tRNA(Gln) amidotransferase subunit C